MAEIPETVSQASSLEDVLAEYLRAVDAGKSPDRQAFLERYPEHRKELEEFFADQVRVDAMLTSLRAGNPRAAFVQPVLADYEILEPIGPGGMGMVYKARQRSVKRIVAVKIIRADRLDSLPNDQRRKMIERFITEAQAAAQLEHDNIIKVYQVGEWQDQPFYAMRYVEGASLSALLEQGPLESRRAAAYIEQVARGLHEAHRHGILHRDVKPHNILVDAASDRPMLADFGLAKLTQAGQNNTVTGDIMGTPPYMSPEQAQSPAGVTVASDVYSLGATLYALLTGGPPFQGGTPVETLRQVLENHPVPPRKRQVSVSKDLETICLKCLHKEPAKRYANCEDLAADLRRFLAGEPIVARPVGMVERTVKWVRRRPAIAALLGALAAVVVIAFTLVTWQLGETRAALERVEQGTRDRALAQVNALRDAAPGAVPNILADLERNRVDVLPQLRKLWAEGGDKTKRMRLVLALLPVEPEMVRVELLTWMLKVEDPAEVLLACEAMLPFKAELTEALWTEAEDAKVPEAERLRALAALAVFDADSPSWNKIGPAAVELMLRANPFFLASWTQALRPVQRSLLGPLGEVFRGQKLAGYQKEAALILADYAADQVHLLADLLMDADDKQFSVIYPKFKEQGEQGLPILSSELDRKPPLDAKNDGKEKLAKRQANAAVAWLRMKQPEKKVWPLLKHGPDPTLRSYLIHRLGPLGADAKTIARRLDEDRDITIFGALILALGAFSEKDLPHEYRSKLVAKLKPIYQADPDPGLHAAAEWLLRHWKQQDWLNQVTADWAKDQEGRETRLEHIKADLRKEKAKRQPAWYVNGQGQTMVVIPGPVEFTMGSPLTEADRRPEETQHNRRIGRTFAIAATAVTKEQFLRFRPNFAQDKMGKSPDLLCPIGNVTWYEAAAYCNWLSKKEGIPQDQWCYETSAGTGDEGNGQVLELTGYRLPREAEMEYACRADALTSHHYGESEELLGNYAWYAQNSHGRTWPVANLKPNDLGLFDTHGNVFSWCHDEYSPYPIQDGKAVEDIDNSLNVKGEQSFSLRGGAFNYQASYGRCARRIADVPTHPNEGLGLRPARTIVP